MEFFNQNSFLVGAISLGFFLLFLLWRWKKQKLWIRAGIFTLFVAAMLSIGLSFRYPDPTVENVQDAEAILNNGQATFLMFYSNY